LLIAGYVHIKKTRVTDSAAPSENYKCAKQPILTTEALSFKEIKADMDNLPIQHYVSSLHGSMNAGEAVLLEEKFLLPANLQSKVATIIQKEKSHSGFVVNFYVFPRPNGIEVTHLPAPQKRTYIGFPAQEIIQTQYMSAVQEARLQALVYLIQEAEILLGWKALCIGILDCFFVRLQATTTLKVEPVEDCCIPLDCQSLRQQTWSIWSKLYPVIMEDLKMKSLNLAYKRNETNDFAEWEWWYMSKSFVDPPLKKEGNVSLCVNRLDGSKESCKVKTTKSSLQFTTSHSISQLKRILGLTIMVSTQNNFRTASKCL
jgi:hypothetical protein